MALLSGSEVKILAFIYRQTFGWHKQTEQISLRRIQLGTGLGKTGVIKSTRRLTDLRLIRRTRSIGKREVYEYEPALTILADQIPGLRRRLNDRRPGSLSEPTTGSVSEPIQRNFSKKGDPRSVGCQVLNVGTRKNAANPFPGLRTEKLQPSANPGNEQLRRHLERGVFRQQVDAAYFDFLHGGKTEAEAIEGAVEEAARSLLSNRGAVELRGVEVRPLIDLAWEHIRPHVKSVATIGDFDRRRKHVVGIVVREVVNAALDLCNGSVRK